MEMIDYVNKGVELLNEHVPDWREKVDVKTLDMGSLENCILGQIYGDYSYGRDRLGLSHGGGAGFDVREGFGEHEYYELTKLWLTEIEDGKADTTKYRWIVYMHQPIGGFDIKRVTSIEDAKHELHIWSGATYTYEQASASLYPYSPEDWASAREMRSVGCPFDYPSKLIEFGPKGGMKVTNA